MGITPVVQTAELQESLIATGFTGVTIPAATGTLQVFLDETIRESECIVEILLAATRTLYRWD